MKYGALGAFLRHSPFSLMALCNIVGDTGYIGFAFVSAGWVSIPKLAGSVFTIAAHIILLAFGDDQARRIGHEEGRLSAAILTMRLGAQHLIKALPRRFHEVLQTKPVGSPFVMLAMIGIGLTVDALLFGSGNIENFLQISLGVLVTVGCLAFASADFVSSQNKANFLLRVGPFALMLATLSNAGLVIATHNVFLFLSLCAFSLANFTAFFTKIDKKCEELG